MKAEQIWDKHFKGYSMSGQIKRNAMPAMNEFATYKMIEENKSMLEMANLHMDERAIAVIQNRIKELEAAV